MAMEVDSRCPLCRREHSTHVTSPCLSWNGCEETSAPHGMQEAGTMIALGPRDFRRHARSDDRDTTRIETAALRLQTSAAFRGRADAIAEWATVSISLLTTLRGNLGRNCRKITYFVMELQIMQKSWHTPVILALTAEILRASLDAVTKENQTLQTKLRRIELLMRKWNGIARTWSTEQKTQWQTLRPGKALATLAVKTTITKFAALEIAQDLKVLRKLGYQTLKGRKPRAPRGSVSAFSRRM